MFMSITPVTASIIAFWFGNRGAGGDQPNRDKRKGEDSRDEEMKIGMPNIEAKSPVS